MRSYVPDRLQHHTWCRLERATQVWPLSKGVAPDGGGFVAAARLPALGEDSDLKAARNGALEWLVTTFLAPFRLNARRKVWTGCHGAVCAIPRKRNPVRGR
jgi:hypothetical protein